MRTVAAGERVIQEGDQVPARYHELWRLALRVLVAGHWNPDYVAPGAGKREIGISECSRHFGTLGGVCKTHRDPFEAV